MNPNEIASLAEEVQSFVKESVAGIGDQVDARLAEAAELLDKVNESNEALLSDAEDRKKELADMADALDFLTDRISELEAVKVTDGKDGIDGVDGKDGSDGIDGVNGEQGEAGVKGADGTDGRDGAGIDVPIYKAGVYREGSVVQANLGQYFKALKDTAEGVDHESWERVGLSGFRMTGAFDESKGYVAGDLYIKNFGLFLSDGEESLCVAGRGPAGKRGEKGLSGKDGAPGADGADGDNFDAIEINGTNLVVVIKKSDGEFETKAVDLSPLLEVTAEITKSVEVKTASEVKAQFEAHAKGLLEYISEHISDQAAVPINFYRGLYTTANTYVRGDTVTYANNLYVTSQDTTAIPDSIFTEGDNPWRMISGGGTGGGEGGADLSGYVKRPSPNLRDGKWLLYRETTDGKREWTPATTDLIETNGQLMFRDIKGQFAPTPEELDELTNQLKVNRFIWERIQELDLKAGGVAISSDAPLDPDNGMFWFDNTESVMQLFIWHEGSEAWIPVAPPTTLEGRVSTGEATQAAIIEQVQESLQVQADILLKVGELEVQKGSVARYKVKGTDFAVATRAGEMYVSSAKAEDVTTISLAAMDLNNNPTKPCNEDDIIEFDWPDGAVARYQVVSGPHDGLVVTYLSGVHTFEADQELETYVYPQNKGSASVEYVDAQDDKLLSKTANNVVNNNFRISRSDGAIYFNVSGGDLVISRLKPPTSDHHAVNKAYVDAATHVPPSTGDVPTTTKLWKYAEGKSKWELSANEFTVGFGDNSTIEVLLCPYLNGRWWAPATATNYSHGIGDCYATITDYQGAVALGFKAWKWWFMQKGTNANNAEVYHNALQGDWLKLGYPEHYRLQDGHWYNLNFPSPFPLVKFPEAAHTAGQGAFGIDELPPLPDDATDMGEVLS